MYASGNSKQATPSKLGVATAVATKSPSSHFSLNHAPASLRSFSFLHPVDQHTKMGSIVLPHLHTAWHTDQAILSESERLVVIRFGKDGHPDCLRQDDVLAKVAEKVKTFAVIYLCDIDEVPDFNSMYELYDPMTIMVCFLFRSLNIIYATGAAESLRLGRG